MKAPGKAQTFAWGIVLVGVTVFSVEAYGAEPTRTPRILTRSSSLPRVLVFKGTPQERAGQLMPEPQTSDPAPQNAAPAPELTAAAASEALATAGISITPAMLGSRKPYTLTPALPRLLNGAYVQFTGAYSGVVSPTAKVHGGFYYFSGPHEGWSRSVEVHVPPAALIVGKLYLVDFSVYSDGPASWRVYMPGGGQEIKLPSGGQHVPVLVTWQGPASSSFHLTLMNLSSSPWMFFSATVTELQ